MLETRESSWEGSTEYSFILPLLLLRYWALIFLVCGHEEFMTFKWNLYSIHSVCICKEIRRLHINITNSYYSISASASIQWMTIFSTNVGGSERVPSWNLSFIKPEWYKWPSFQQMLGVQTGFKPETSYLPNL